MVDFDQLTYIKAVALAESGWAGEFIILSPREVVFTVIQPESEAATSIPTDFYAEITRDTHGAVKAISRLGEDR